VLAPLEVELLNELIEGDRNKKRVSGSVILTNRRVVVLISKPSPTLNWWLSPMLLFAQQVGRLEMTHQIERDDFDSVESHGGEMVSFHSKGQGYGHISFVVYSMTPFAIWRQRMHQWAAGTYTADPLPTAKLVDS
jgi:hypothetical protein